VVVPLIGRSVAAVAGALLVLAAWASAVGTLIVPRSVSSWLTVGVDRVVNGAFRLASGAIAAYRRRDRVLAGQAAAILVGQLAAWLATSFVGFWLLLWPFESGGLGSAFSVAGSALFTLGFAVPAGGAPSAIVTAAGATGLVIVTLQIAYLPTLYAAFNRRETEESHTTYLPLVRFRSPRPLSSWVTALLAVLDSAALFLALSPKAAPTVPARLCLRAGFLCFNQIASAMGIQVPAEADPPGTISLTYQEFLDGIERMRKVDFPIERDPAAAWTDFVGWRANYERAAYAVAADLHAVPALWSGTRRPPTPAIPPFRPPLGRPPR
jgi:hypothetical protein